MVRHDRLLGSTLCAVFEQSGNHLELSGQFIHVGPNWNDKMPKAHLMMDNTANLQVWRNPEASSHAAQVHFKSISMNMQEFAINSMAKERPELMPKDMVYIMHECALAEVKATTPGDESKIKVSLATELRSAPGRSVTRTFFRFEQGAKQMIVARSEVQFPVDVTFNPEEGFFQVVKCKGMSSI